MENISFTDLSQKLTLLLNNKPTIDQVRAFLSEVKEVYNDLSENDKTVIRRSVEFLASQTSLNEMLVPNENFVIDRGSKGHFDPSTLEFVKDRMNSNKILLACYNGISRSKDLRTTISSNTRDDRFLTIENSDELKSGYTSIPSLILFLKKRIRASIKEPIDLFLFSNESSDEAKLFIEKIFQYMKDDEISFIDKINILLGDFSCLGIEHLYIIQKPG